MTDDPREARAEGLRHKHDWANYEICRICGQTEAAAKDECHHCNDSMSVKNGRCWWCLRPVGEASTLPAPGPSPAYEMPNPRQPLTLDEPGPSLTGDEQAEWFRKGWEAGHAAKSPGPSPSVRALEKPVAALRELLTERWVSHRDKDSPDYNACDVDGECAWCEETKQALGEIEAALTGDQPQQEQEKQEDATRVDGQ